MNTRYKHRCPSCLRVVHTRSMYCVDCIRASPERRHVKLRYGQQKWLNGVKLPGVSLTRAKMLVVVGKDRRWLCIECGTDLTECSLMHKCYTRSKASGFRGDNITCPVCKNRKHLSEFPILERRIYTNCVDTLSITICCSCLEGKMVLPTEESGYEIKPVHL